MKEEQNLTEPKTANGIKQCVSGSLPIAELEGFFYEMGEDWHLWDEEEQGHYPIQRIFDAVKKFIEEKKLGNDR